MNRESLIQEISKWQREITDLQDILDDGCPAGVTQKIVAKIQLLQDLIFSNNEMLDEIADYTF